WVYQRIGSLEEAQVAATRSLKLGEAVGWDRNTAFCLKCTGRLLRMMAERTPDPLERERLLKESEDHLQKAVCAFAKASDPDLGPTSCDVGDSYSLLGRTRLVRGHVREALEAVEKAR